MDPSLEAGLEGLGLEREQESANAVAGGDVYRDGERPVPPALRDPAIDRHAEAGLLHPSQLCVLHPFLLDP
ncbi:MAG: hypothetical protein ACRCZF_27390, partial [Gemmataceae bacterium]